MPYSTEALKSLWVSTQKAVGAALNWLSLLVRKISEGYSIKRVLHEYVEMIAKLCDRAHPQRNFKATLSIWCYFFSESRYID
jgi:hypothetical protein